MAPRLSAAIGGRSQTWPLDQPLLRIGRSSRCAIQLADATVSKEHAEITRQGDRWLVRDLGSRNGTRVNGAPATGPVPVSVGDRLEIGSVMLQVEDGDAPAPLRLSDATVVQSSTRMRIADVLERQTRTGAGNAAVLRLLAEAGQLLVLPRPLAETCQEILKFVERAIPGSRHSLMLIEPGAAEPVQVAASGRGGARDRPLGLSRSIMRTVLDECTSVLTRDAATDQRFAGQQSIIAQAIHSAMAVPLFDNEKVLGLIYVDSTNPAVTYADEQLEILTLLANMAAVKISNARLLEAERQADRIRQEVATAALIQRGLLPVQPPAVAGHTFDAYLESCYEVGGDLYDFHIRADGRVIFMAGDVTGKGMGAALLMSSFLASARVLYDTCQDPGELATRLGDIVHRSTDAGRFVTGFVGVLEPASGTLDYVNAGHPPPLLLCGGELRELPATGVPFGILPGFVYRTTSTRLEPGELLALYSDGIPEAQRGDDFFDDERLHQALRECADMTDLPAVSRHLLERVETWLEGAARSDDVTLVLLRREPATA
jgi:phosphoserine phosphatase RsbU/P